MSDPHEKPIPAAQASEGDKSRAEESEAGELYSEKRKRLKPVLVEKYTKKSEFENVSLDETLKAILQNSNLSSGDLFHTLGIKKESFQSKNGEERTRWRLKNPDDDSNPGFWEDPDVIKAFVIGMSKAHSKAEVFSVIADLFDYMDIPYTVNIEAAQKTPDLGPIQNITPEIMSDRLAKKGVPKEKADEATFWWKVMKPIIKNAALAATLAAALTGSMSPEKKSGIAEAGEPNIETTDTKKETANESEVVMKEGDTVYGIVENMLKGSKLEGNVDALNKLTVKVLLRNEIGDEEYGLTGKKDSKHLDPGTKIDVAEVLKALAS